MRRQRLVSENDFFCLLKKSDFVGHILRYLFTAPVWQKRIDRPPDFQAFPITCLTHIGSDHCSWIRRTGGKYAYCRCSKQSAAELYVYINGCVRSSSIREVSLALKNCGRPTRQAHAAETTTWHTHPSRLATAIDIFFMDKWWRHQNVTSFDSTNFFWSQIKIRHISQHWVCARISRTFCTPISHSRKHTHTLSLSLSLSLSLFLSYSLLHPHPLTLTHTRSHTLTHLNTP